MFSDAMRSLRPRCRIAGRCLEQQTGEASRPAVEHSSTSATTCDFSVYNGGSLVAKSDGIISSSQSVLIPQGENGLYQIYVAFDQDSSSPEIPYEALAEVEYAPKPQPARPLLPDLVARAQRNLTFQTPFLDFFEPPPAPGETCYPSEVAEEGAQTCLRFDQVFANTGEGPMEMRFVIPHDPGVDRA